MYIYSITRGPFTVLISFNGAWPSHTWKAEEQSWIRTDNVSGDWHWLSTGSCKSNYHWMYWKWIIVHLYIKTNSTSTLCYSCRTLISLCLNQLQLYELKQKDYRHVQNIDYFYVSSSHRDEQFLKRLLIKIFFNMFVKNYFFYLFVC